MAEHELLLDVKNLKVNFELREGTVQAVNGVNLSIHRGKTLGVVGESGCGKSISARATMGIIPVPGKIVEGEILFHTRSRNGEGYTIDLAKLDPRGKEIRDIRGAEIAMVFQEPMTSLSPVHTIGNQIMEGIILHQHVKKAEARTKAIDMLNLVGMPKPEQAIDSYPHQLSGGMRQRAVIAMALACHPTLLIADEPTTALDVTTEAQILELMRELQQKLGMAILFITHNLGVIAEMAEDVLVMYLGRVMEKADVDTIFYAPKHPYTQALLKSIPRIDKDEQDQQRLETIKGMVPSAAAIPRGCPFHPRCVEFIAGVCDVKTPSSIEIAPGHTVECHLYGKK